MEIKEYKISCFQEALKQVCEKYGKEFQIFFAGEWGFFISEEESKTIGDRINFYEKYRMNEFIERHMGFKVHFCKNVEVIPQLFKESMSDGNAVMVGMDAYGCPWNPAYKKVHMPHFFLLENWDSQSKKMECRDTFYSSESYFLNYDDLKPYFNDARIFRNVRNIKKLEMKALKEILVQNYKKAKERPKYYFQIFAECISNFTDIDEIFPSDVEVENQLLFQKLRGFATVRYGLGDLIMQYSPEDYNYVEEFKALGQLWEQLRMMLLKVCLRQKMPMEKREQIVEIIQEISKKEELLYNKIGEE